MDINAKEKKKLIQILSDLISVIVEMRKTSGDFLLGQNEREAREWLFFLKEHDDIEEIQSLKKEVVNRFVDRFDVQICDTELDDKRVELMKKFIYKTGKVLKHN